MLVILSEINCLDTLNRLGVFPDLFYTDFDAFKTETFLFNQANVIILFAGNCRFKKRLILEQVMMLQNRANNPEDKGILNLYIVSDSKLPSLSSYYSYEHHIDKIFKTENWKVKDEVKFWDIFKSQPKQSKLKLSAYDLGDASEAMERFNNRRTTSEDDYLDLIITPDLSSIQKRRVVTA